MPIALPASKGVRTRSGRRRTGPGQKGNTGQFPAGNSPPADADGQPNQLTGPEKRLLDRLDHIWRQYEARGLTVRHEMGTLLNAQLGLPTQRQPHGQWVLKQVSVRLRIAESELSRMRWFAHHFKTVAGLRRRHPEVRSWTGVRELLPSLKDGGQAGRNGQDGASPAGRPARGAPKGPAGAVQRSLKNLAAAVRKHGAALRTEAERKAVMEKLLEVGKVLEETLQIRLTVEPSPTPRRSGSMGRRSAPRRRSA